VQNLNAAQEPPLKARGSQIKRGLNRVITKAAKGAEVVYDKAIKPAYNKGVKAFYTGDLNATDAELQDSLGGFLTGFHAGHMTVGRAATLGRSSTINHSYERAWDAMGPRGSFTERASNWSAGAGVGITYALGAYAAAQAAPYAMEIGNKAAWKAGDALIYGTAGTTGGVMMTGEAAYVLSQKLYLLSYHPEVAKYGYVVADIIYGYFSTPSVSGNPVQDLAALISCLERAGYLN
jgi:hypothetical protein